MDVGGALLAPKPPPIAQRPFEVRIGGRHSQHTATINEARRPPTIIAKVPADPIDPPGKSHGHYDRRSITMAMPWPPPTHMDSRP